MLFDGVHDVIREQSSIHAVTRSWFELDENKLRSVPFSQHNNGMEPSKFEYH